MARTRAPSRRCLGSRAPGGRPTTRTAHARPRDIQFNCRHGRRARRRRGTRAPDVQSPGADPPSTKRRRGPARSFAIRPSCGAGAGKAKGCTALRRIETALPVPGWVAVAAAPRARADRDGTRHTAAGGTDRASNPSPHLATSMLRVVHQSQLKDRSRCESFCADRRRHRGRRRHASLLWACFIRFGIVVRRGGGRGTVCSGSSASGRPAN